MEHEIRNVHSNTTLKSTDAVPVGAPHPARLWSLMAQKLRAHEYHFSPRQDRSTQSVCRRVSSPYALPWTNPNSRLSDTSLLGRPNLFVWVGHGGGTHERARIYIGLGSRGNFWKRDERRRRSRGGSGRVGRWGGGGAGNTKVFGEGGGRARYVCIYAQMGLGDRWWLWGCRVEIGRAITFLKTMRFKSKCCVTCEYEF
ncbi:hypothetical protein NEOLEDRAFT_932581 [Neolentinus lepideus HHB14362 ss-1]|uniref:Uncharacterized protein n=1 Tax=Neolentinus lepideus HHB14362 ss-1 TaxID=1314782 RepID=A0A165NJV3_9AGAM|nr:hypothetical protein NEOLEDRAFT_932581 [Neolentinus lepideus HHB14362 ss-1]